MNIDKYIKPLINNLYQEYLYYLDRISWYKIKWFNISFRKLQFMVFKQTIKNNIKKHLNKWV